MYVIYLFFEYALLNCIVSNNSYKDNPNLLVTNDWFEFVFYLKQQKQIRGLISLYCYVIISLKREKKCLTKEERFMNKLREKETQK